MPRFLPLWLAVALVGCSRTKPAEPDPPAPSRPTAAATSASRTAPTGKSWGSVVSSVVAPTVDEEKSKRPYTVETADKVCDDYKNEAGGDEKYKGRRVRVVGLVDRVERVPGNEKFPEQLQLSVRAFSDRSGVSRVVFVFPIGTRGIGELREGDVVVCDGTGNGVIRWVPYFRACLLKGSGYDTPEAALDAAAKLD